MKPTPDAAEIVTQLRCASRVRDENYIPLHLSPADCKLAADEIERLRAALRWVREVYPGKNRESGGAIVHMTWEQWNEMRACMGLRALPPPRGSSETVRVINWRRAAEQSAREEGK